jgi:hypothetical protein
MRASVRTLWNRFWFEPAPPARLAICRVLFFGAFFVYYLRINYAELSDLPAHSWHAVWPFELVETTLPSTLTLNVLQWLWSASLLGACLGVAYRWTSLAAFALGLYLIGLTEHIARINHSDAIVVFGLAIMALSRAADTLSIDTRLGRISNKRLDESGEYTWPIRVMWLVIVTIYFASGVTKLVTSGLAWITSDHVSNLLMLAPVSGSPLTRLGQQIGRHRELSTMLAALTLAIELAAPLALASGYARRIVVPSLYAMQFGVRVLLGPGFTEFLVCGLFWIPWDRLDTHFRFSSPRVKTVVRDVQTYGISGASSGRR